MTDDRQISVCTISVQDYVRRIDQLVDIHLRAMSYPPETFHQRRQLWLTNARKDGFRCVVALSHPARSVPDPGHSAHRVVGVAYGFPGDPTSWWYREVRRGLVSSGMTAGSADDLLADYDEISEIHVHPDFQGRGVGRALLNALLPHLRRPVAMLSTPEVTDEDNAAWALYRATGFRDVLRGFRFGSDPRPFGVLSLTRDSPAGRPQRTMS
ncbi:N-acetyltransferase [Corynebacterium sp.]|uniref:GNAT family N-acetyltransferase n=1 Tax=Corynebacterium sp. TaxID=1720 RepID=UPI0025BB0863|nr:N-acetyltransferase [Corynebacterium sp.]